MSPTLPVAEVAAKVPSTKAWLLLLSLLSTLLVVSHQSRRAPAALAGRPAPAAPRAPLSYPTTAEAAPVAAL